MPANKTRRAPMSHAHAAGDMRMRFDRKLDTYQIMLAIAHG